VIGRGVLRRDQYDPHAACRNDRDTVVEGSTERIFPGNPASDRIVLAVVTRDRASLLARFLLPDLVRLGEAGFGVAVVDQSRGEETRQLVAGVPGVTYLTSGPGLSRGRNAAAGATDSELLAFTDDDVSLPPDWLERLVAAFDAEPSAGAVCGRGVTPDGTLLPGRPAGLYRFPTNPFGLGSGFNVAFRRAALAAAGPFDEELGAGARFHAGEDTDMLYRIMRAGWAVSCSDDVTVTHYEWRRAGQELRLHYRYGLGAGAQTARHVSEGDREAGRIAREEARKHVAVLVRAALTLRLRVARVQLPFLAGLAAGYLRRRRGGQDVMRR